MSGLDSIVEHQGFYDFLNHIISGSIFIIGAEVIVKMFNFSLIQAVYTFIGLWPRVINEFIWNVCVILLFLLISFLIGIAIQELYSKIYEHNRILAWLSERCKKSSNSISSLKLLRILRILLRRTTFRDCMKNLLDEDGPISNQYKRKQYEKLAEIFQQSFSGKLDEEESEVNKSKDDMNSYFFAYCVYYIQIKNQNRKTEKLRDITGLSKELSLVFLFLAFFSIVAVGVSICLFSGENGWYLFLICLLCEFLSIIMNFRTEKSIKNRIRMTLAIYDVEKREEKA